MASNWRLQLLTYKRAFEYMANDAATPKLHHVMVFWPFVDTGTGPRCQSCSVPLREKLPHPDARWLCDLERVTHRLGGGVYQGTWYTFDKSRGADAEAQEQGDPSPLPWFLEDFMGTAGALLNYLAATPLATELEIEPLAPDDDWILLLYEIAQRDECPGLAIEPVRLKLPEAPQVGNKEQPVRAIRLVPDVAAASSLALDWVLATAPSESVRVGGGAEPHQPKLEGPDLNPTEECIIEALRLEGRRLTTKPLLEKAVGVVNSNGKATLSSLVKRRILDNKLDASPRGYGLPEWSDPGQDHGQD